MVILGLNLNNSHLNFTAQTYRSNSHLVQWINLHDNSQSKPTEYVFLISQQHKRKDYSHMAYLSLDHFSLTTLKRGHIVGEGHTPECSDVLNEKEQ